MSLFYLMIVSLHTTLYNELYYAETVSKIPTEKKNSEREDQASLHFPSRQNILFKKIVHIHYSLWKSDSHAAL